jgi:hypothetical protein
MLARWTERFTVGLFAAGVLVAAPGFLFWSWGHRRRHPAFALPHWRGPPAALARTELSPVRV